MSPGDGQRTEGARTRPLADALRRLEVHDHAALLFGQDEERAEAAGTFLRLGLERGEACLHLAGPAHASAVLPHVRAGGVDAGEALASGRLALVTAPGVLRSGNATPGELSAWFRAALEGALKGGARTLRLSAEPSWTAGDEASLDRLLACEAALKEALRDVPVVALFQYDRRRLTAGQQAAALRMHPLVLHRGELCSNALFVPPPPGGRAGDDAVERMLEVVKDHHRVEQAFALGRQRLRRALDGGAHGLWDWHLASGRILFDRRRLDLCGVERRRAWLALQEWEQRIHPDDLGPLWRAVRAHLDGQAARFEHEHRVRQGSGRARWICVRGEVVERDRAGAPTRLAGTFTDVTGLRAMRERQAARDRLTSLSALSSAVAHEVNNPLAWIGANLGFLRERLRDEKVVGALGEDAGELRGVLAECQEGVTRIRDAVSVLRSVGGPDDGLARPRDLREELLAAVGLASEEVARWARIELALPDELPPVAAHPALRTVLANLVVSAAHGLPESRGRDQVVTVRAVRAERQLHVEVETAAAGLPATSVDGDPSAAPGPFTARPAGSAASRLAAPFSLAIVEAAGGRLESELKKGKRITRVVFPVFGVHPPDRSAE